MKNQITTDIRFSIIPEALLDADITDRAVRIYALLARYADNETGQCFPSRETLAKRARCHWRSVDRAIQELVNIGALTKQHRKNGDSYQSNLYTVHKIWTGVSTGSDTGVTGVLTPQSVGTDTGGNLTRTTELEPKELDIAFDKFWYAYPKKADKALARRSFEKALKRASAEELITAAARYRDEPGRDPAFTKNPSTWLNADSWLNEPTAEKVKPTAEGPGRREWVKQLHDQGEHFACEPGEFGNCR